MDISVYLHSQTTKFTVLYLIFLFLNKVVDYISTGLVDYTYLATKR